MIFNILKMSVSTENFLKAIFHFQNEGLEANSSRMAKKLGISNAAVTDMAKKLSRQKLIIYQKYKGLKLTEKGRTLAVSIIRRHRLWELFLHDVLGLSWAEVHDEAEMLEHQTSNFLIEKIDKYLGHPEFDPHGAPIPDQRWNIS